MTSVPVALPLGVYTVVHSLAIANFLWGFRAVREKKAIHANNTLFFSQKVQADDHWTTVLPSSRLTVRR